MKEKWRFRANKFEILHVSVSFVNAPVHRDVIHFASAIHSLGRFYVLRKFVLIRRAPVLLLPFLGFVCYEKETDSHVGLPDLLGMTVCEPNSSVSSLRLPLG